MSEIAQAREYADGEVVPGTPYRVVRMIGAGGMGCVYEVEHVELLRRFVLKSLLKSLASREDLIARMRNEWRALGRLSHENIVDVVNAGMSSTGAPFYVMELLVGETLSQRMRRHSRLPYEEAARIAREILLGLSAAHRIDVVHRDIKPANIFVTEEETVKVLDFGIAKVRDDSTTQTTAHGLAIGTPRYMSPEQVSGAMTTARSDLYAVGLLLFEMIAGSGPFDDARGQTEQMLSHVSRQAPLLSERAEIPAELDALVARALAKLPADRPSSATEMAELLAPFAGPRRRGAWASVVALPPMPTRGPAEGESRPPIPTPELDSDEKTIEQPVAIPNQALPSSPQGTPKEPSSVEVEALTIFDKSTPHMRTELLSALFSDEAALRDAETRTSPRALGADALAMMTPPPVHTLTPADPAKAMAPGKRKLVRAGAVLALAGLGAVGLLFSHAAGGSFRAAESAEPLHAEPSPAAELLAPPALTLIRAVAREMPSVMEAASDAAPMDEVETALPAAVESSPVLAPSAESTSAPREPRPSRPPRKKPSAGKPALPGSGL